MEEETQVASEVSVTKVVEEKDHKDGNIKVSLSCSSCCILAFVILEVAILRVKSSARCFFSFSVTTLISSFLLCQLDILMEST